MNQAQLTVSHHMTTDGVHVVVLAGEIDHTTTDLFRQALTAQGGFAPHTVMDFRAGTFMDSSGINMLVAANNAARAGSGWLRLACTPKPMADLLHVVGLDDVIDLYPTLEQAVAPQTAA
ncbi:anti-anti-sigma factor [Streptomyces sp. 3330]|uniref:STAS domain-containing protein n=1 Tax=Streptomyces sp. 3330 TaxID=2817755 RepID=UPI0028658887|nr:STAS domain-containing protein [Streptomyces sp. 3330]MDR6980953.1 anti-anti-sigma factor [Streptomyces sp. 3330]